ncbi:FecR domain-containing protein [Sphingomonas sp. PB2P19]|uniref:FecR family protein n=1 Tax=Sphingomonas rhamnosi TaxID=3096156 RepID=UPI002FC83A4A
MTHARTTTAADAAATWHARLDSPDMDWEAFGEWLGEHPSHRDAYDAIALLDAEIGHAAPAIGTLLPSNDDASHTDPIAIGRPRSRWPRWAGVGLGGALAAGLAITVVGPSADGAAQVYVTGRGETRAVTLADGSRIEIDRGSRIAVSGGRAPIIDIARGAASFAVRHDPSRELMVRAGGYEIRDLGTRFAVVNARGRVAVTVAQGMVSVTPTSGAASDAVVLKAGQGLDIVPDKQIAQRRVVDPNQVADWTDGRLDYDGAPLALLAGDISRYADAPLMVDPSAADLRFSGVLTIGDGSRLVDQLRAVLPIRVRRVDGVVHLGAAGAR